MGRVAPIVRVVCVGVLGAGLFGTHVYAEEGAEGAEGADETEDVGVTVPASVEPIGSAGLRDLALHLKVRESAIERRESGFQDREDDLHAVEERLEARITELTALRDEIGGQLAQVDTKTAERRDGLVKMFEGMRSKDAAAVLTQLDRELATEVLDNMNRTKAGKLLAAMSPSAAARLAERMARPVIVESR